MSEQENRDESINQREGSISQSTKVEIGERTLSIISLVFACVGISLASVSTYVALWSVKEYKQVQVQLMYANAIMLREGLVQPGDMVYGPEGNLEYKQHELRKK